MAVTRYKERLGKPQSPEAQVFEFGQSTDSEELGWLPTWELITEQGDCAFVYWLVGAHSKNIALFVSF